MGKLPHEVLDIVKEKSLEGEGDRVLRMVRLDDPEAGENDIRLYHSVRNLFTSSVFGGETSEFITPEDCHRYFDLIKTNEQFFELSERIRKMLLDTLKANR